MNPKNKDDKISKGTDLSYISEYSIPFEKHHISKNKIHPLALKIIHKLEEHNYQAFIVGGAIRDLLCNIEPKDFDIATNARPEEIEKIFKNSRLIGRRFRLAHIFFGRDIFEVATFRGNHEEDSQSTLKNNSHIAENGQLLRDNIYGEIWDDASRRDFGVNSLYYSPTNECIYDFNNALQDIHDKHIKLIGNPEQRYAEDPVRMLRALRFSSKLNFNIEKNTALQIPKSAPLILNVSNARLFDESIKLFHNEQASEIFPLFVYSGLLEKIFPFYFKYLSETTWAENLLHLALENTSERIKQNKPVTIAYLYAVILWPEFLKRSSIKNAKAGDLPKLELKALALIKEQSEITSIPKRHAYAIKDIWEYQVRLQERNPKKITWLLQQKRFRAAFDFLLLREASGELEPGLGDWWEKIQHSNSLKQEEMILALPAITTNKRKPQKKRNR